MPFKINISDKGKALKLEQESEALIGKTIGEKFDGKEISSDLEGYELEITGTSDKAGFPGLPNVKGPRLKKVLLKKGMAMHNKRKGVRLRKTVRGNEISQDTVQINIKVIKPGNKKFEDLLAPKPAEGEAEKPVEEKKEEKPVEAKKE